MCVTAHERAATRAVPTAREVFLSPQAGSDPVRQDERERAFFTSIRLPNRVYKTTYSRRLDDLNELIHALLPAGRPLQIMDTAVSTGVTTWEWAESLRRHGTEFTLTAGDLTTHAYLLSVGRDLHALVDDAGTVWQYEVRGQAVPNPPGKRNWLRHLPDLLLLKLTVRSRFPRLREAARAAGSRPARAGRVACQRIALVSARLRQLPNVCVLEDDLRARNPALDRRFDVLRAANILNKYYFEDATLTAILANLRSRLKGGGLLAVCRTDESGKNDGTVFRLEPSGSFAALARVGAGSEVEDLVLGLPPAP